MKRLLPDLCCFRETSNHLMPMKRTRLIAKLLFLLAIGMDCPLAMSQTAEKSDGHKASQTPAPTSINLSQRESGWRITVLPDGSGTAAYGSSYFHVFLFPKETVSFWELLPKAMARPLVPDKDPLSVEVSVSVVGEAASPKMESRAMASEWNELWATITPHLRSPAPERLTRLLENQSPLRKIPPQPAPPRDEKAPVLPKK